jgi:hypothetical protein
MLRIIIKGLFWLIIIILSPELCFGNLIENGNFEHGIPNNWIKYGNIKLEDGYKGKAISISGKGMILFRVTGIEPNKYYLFSFLIKRDGFKDGEYPIISIFGKYFYINELFSWGRWVKLSFFIKSKNNVGEIKLINPGLSHKLYFDEIRLIEFRVNPIYPKDRGIVSDIWPKFSYNIPKTEHILRIRIDISKDINFKDKISLRSFNIEGSTISLKRSLDRGLWYWRIHVYKGKEEICKSDIQSFYFVPFFPIGIYSAEIEAFKELKEIGFNSVQSYSRNIDFIEKFVFSAKKNDLKAMIMIPKEVWRRDPSQFFKNMRNSKSILAWYLEDEPEGRGIPPSYIFRLRRYLKIMDSNHPTSLVILRSKKAYDYGEVVDIIMVDPYPIPNMPIKWLSDSIDEAISYKKNVWAVIQAFNWGSMGRDGRDPTYEEMRCLTYLAIVHGAKGIFYYTYKGSKYKIKEHEGIWNGLKRIISELKYIYPLLTVKNVSHKLRSNKEIDFIVKEFNKKKYIIAVNKINKPIEALFWGKTLLKKRVRVLFENRILNIKDGILRDHFDPYGVHVYLIY